MKIKEVAPPGWEGTVAGMKAHPEIEKPFALAWYLADNGANAKEAEADLIGSWRKFKNDPACLTYSEKYEANAASSQGALLRPNKTESKAATLHLGVRFLEAGEINETSREIPVIIIKEGMGNKADRHFYSADLLARVAPKFDGVKAYANHPSKTEETDRPERSIQDIVGWYHSAKVVMIEGKSAIQAVLKINDGAAYEWAWNLVKEAAAFAKKFKDKEYVGISINAFGASHAVEAADGVLNMVDDLTEVQSADIVTQAGAGGGFRLREAVKKALAREVKPQEGLNMDPKEAMAKHGEGLKALHDQIKANPEHAKAYGPAMEALMAHHAEMLKSSEAAPAAAPAASPDDVAAEKKEAERRATEAKDFEKLTESYKAGKLSATEKVIYESLAKERAERAVEKHVAFVAASIKESGIPEAYAGDLTIICAGKSEAEVKTLIEARKKIVAPLMGDHAVGAGAGGVKGKTDSKLSAKLAESGVKMAAAK